MERAARVAGGPEVSELGGTSAGGIIVMCVVIVIALLALIGAVLYAVRHPHWRHPKVDIYDKPGSVRGGVHVGDPGSRSPNPETPVNAPERDVPPGG
jgi:hypothetical protein